MRGGPLRQRFDDRWMPEPNSGCWLWLGQAIPTTGGMRPQLYEDGRTQRAHRIAWKLYKGPIPKGLLVCHKCDVTLCVNPDHLFLGTDQDNVDDKMRKGRQARGLRCAWRRKLTGAQIDFILRSKEFGRVLGERFGVHKTTISRIRAGRTYLALSHPSLPDGEGNQ